MDKKRLIFFLFLLSLIVIPLFLQSTPAAGKRNVLTHFLSLQTTNVSNIELGYGPSLVYPTTSGIPIYTLNDQLWIQSNYQITISVSLQEGGVDLASASVSPNSNLRLYTFSDVNLPSSNLTLVVSSYIFNYYTIPLQYVNPSSEKIGSLVSDYSLTNSTLSTSFLFNSTNKFNIEECLTASSYANITQVAIPKQMGSGYLGVAIDPNGTVRLLTRSASVAPFTFSFELLSNYGFLLNGTQGVVSSELQVASSSSEFISSPGPEYNLTLSSMAGERIGRYTLRAFFENATGTLISETPLLSNGNSWFWLGACQSLNTVITNPFYSKLDLSGPSSQWPRFLYLMYQGSYGVDGFANVSLSLQINRVSFVIASTNGTLPSDIKVLASRDQNIKDIGIESGVVYILSSSYPLDENFSLAFGGKVFSTQSARFTSPLTQVQELVNLSLISVSVRSNGVGIVNATVNVYFPGGT